MPRQMPEIRHLVLAGVLSGSRRSCLRYPRRRSRPAPARIHAFSASQPLRSISSGIEVVDVDLDFVCMPACTSALGQRLVGVLGEVDVLADEGDGPRVRDASAHGPGASQRKEVGRPRRGAERRARSRRASGRAAWPGSCRSNRRRGLDDGRSSTLQNSAILRARRPGSGGRVRHSRTSGWMPISRSSLTECCVGLVFSLRRRRDVRQQRQVDVAGTLFAAFSMPIWRIASRNGRTRCRRPCRRPRRQHDVGTLAPTFDPQALDLVGDVRDDLHRCRR